MHAILPLLAEHTKAQAIHLKSFSKVMVLLNVKVCHGGDIMKYLMEHKYP